MALEVQQSEAVESRDRSGTESHYFHNPFSHSILRFAQIAAISALAGCSSFSRPAFDTSLDHEPPPARVGHDSPHAHGTRFTPGEASQFRQVLGGVAMAELPSGHYLVHEREGRYCIIDPDEFGGELLELWRPISRLIDSSEQPPGTEIDAILRQFQLRVGNILSRAPVLEGSIPPGARWFDGSTQGSPHPYHEEAALSRLTEISKELGLSEPAHVISHQAVEAVIFGQKYRLDQAAITQLREVRMAYIGRVPARTGARREAEQDPRFAEHFALMQSEFKAVLNDLGNHRKPRWEHYEEVILNPTAVTTVSEALNVVRYCGADLVSLPEQFQRNYDVVMAAVVNDPRALGVALSEYQADRRIVLQAVRQDGTVLRFAPAFQDDAEIVMAAILQRASRLTSPLPCIEALGCASERLQNSREFLLDVACRAPQVLPHLPESYFNSIEFALELVGRNSRAARYVSGTIQESIEFRRPALLDNGEVLFSLSEAYSSDRESVLWALKSRRGSARSILKELPLHIRDDRALVWAAVGREGSALEFASPELKRDPSIVRRAVRKDPLALAFADPSQQDDVRTVLTAVERNTDAIVYASERLLADSHFHREAVRENGLVLGRLPAAVSTNRQLVRDSLLSNSAAFSWLPSELLPNDETAARLIFSNANLHVRMQERFSPEQLAAEYPQACRAAQQMKDAFSVLNISHWNRFEDSRAVIRGRFSVAPNETRSRLIEILGEDYFRGIENDERPACLIVYGVDDHNGAFTNHNLDRLSRAYRVVYYDIPCEASFLASMKEGVCPGLALVVIGGHGTQNSTRFGTGSHEGNLLDLSDTDMAEQLRALRIGRIPVVLMSCSTGRGQFGGEGIDNIAELVHSYFPLATVYAPLEDDYCVFELNDEGLFVSPGYMCGDMFCIKPETSSQGQRWSAHAP